MSNVIGCDTVPNAARSLDDGLRRCAAYVAGSTVTRWSKKMTKAEMAE